MNRINLIFLVGAVFIAEGKHLPSYIKPCKKDDPKLNECAIHNGQEAIPYIVKGDKELGIPVLAPLFLPQINLQTGHDLEIQLNDVYLRGLENVKITDIKINLKESQASGEISLDSLTIEGQFKINGRILVLTLNGTGPANITCRNLVVKFHLNYDLVTKKDGKLYMDNMLPEFSYTVGQLHFSLKNLFNGDEDLGNRINQFLNEHAAELNEDFSSAISETVKEITVGIFQKIGPVVPYEEIFV